MPAAKAAPSEEKEAAVVEPAAAELKPTVTEPEAEAAVVEPAAEELKPTVTEPKGAGSTEAPAPNAKKGKRALPSASPGHGGYSMEECLHMLNEKIGDFGDGGSASKSARRLIDEIE